LYLFIKLSVLYNIVKEGFMMGLNGARLKNLRESRGLTPGRMADILNVSRTAYMKYETGETSHPRKLDELAQFFNVSTDFLLGRDTDPATDPKGYYNDPKVADRVEALQENPKLRILMDASRDLTNEDIDYVVKTVEMLRKARGID